MKKSDLDLEEVKTLSLELQMEISKLKSSLYKLETDIGLLQSGDNNGPYWNGSNAYDVITSCIGHFEHDKNLISNLEKCSDYVVSTIK